MSVQPYQTKPGFLYIPCKRGDGIIAPNKPEQVRLRNGMCGGYIDPEDWTTPPELSKYTQGETLWIEVPKTDQNKDFCVEAGKPVAMPKDGEAPSKNYRRMKHWIDFSALTPHTPDFMTHVYDHKKQIPVMRLNALPMDAVKLSSALKLTDRLIADVGQITAGTYTVGPGGGDNYPTFGGAGGGWAALGNLTGNLTFQLTGNITETAAATNNIANNGFTFDNTSNSPHNGDPTQGYLIQINQSGAAQFADQSDGAGQFIFRNIHARWIAAFNNANNMLWLDLKGDAAQIASLYNLLLDGNGARARRCILIGATIIGNVHVYSVVGWDTQDEVLRTDLANSLVENMAAYNAGTNSYELVGVAATLNNCTGYGSAAASFNGIAAATGNNNVSSDATAADGNWAAGANNRINAVVANDVQSVNDAVATFFDITAGGPLDGTGIANTIGARTTCIRNRAVPGPNGTSVGPAEIVTPDAVSQPDQSHIAIAVGTGIF